MDGEIKTDNFSLRDNLKENTLAGKPKCHEFEKLPRKAKKVKEGNLFISFIVLV